MSVTPVGGEPVRISSMVLLEPAEIAGIVFLPALSLKISTSCGARTVRSTMGFTERRHFLVLDKAVCSHVHGHVHVHVPSLIKHGEEGSDRHVIR